MNRGTRLCLALGCLVGYSVSCIRVVPRGDQPDCQLTVQIETEGERTVGADLEFSPIVSGGVGPYEYVWTSEDAGIAGHGEQLRASFPEPGTYTLNLVVTDQNDCVTAESIPVIIEPTVSEPPDLAFVNDGIMVNGESLPNGPIAVNEGDELEFDASAAVTGGEGDYTFEWVASDDETIIGTGPTLTLTATLDLVALTLRVTDEAGNTVEVTIFFNVIPTVSPPGKPVVDFSATALEQTITLEWNAVNADSCTASGSGVWSGAQTTTGATVLTPGVGEHTFTLACTGPGGTTTATAAATILAPTPLPVPTVDLTTNLVSGFLTLSWTSTNADVCVASGAWSGQKGEIGAEVSQPSAGTNTYTLTCTGPGGSAADTATVTVPVNPPPNPTVDLKINGLDGPVTVVANTTVTMSWTSTNTTSLTASGAWSGQKASTGSEVSAALVAGTHVFVLTASGAGGSVSDTVTVNVIPVSPGAVTVDLKANGSDGTITVPNGTVVTLSWTSTNATAVVAGSNWSGNKPLAGSEQTVALGTGTYVYSLTATGAAGSITDTVTVMVSPPVDGPAPPVVFIGAKVPNGNVVVGSLTVMLLPSGVSEPYIITWGSANAAQGTLTATSTNNSWTGVQALDGSTGQLTSSVVGDITYTLSYTGPNGTTQGSVVIHVVPAS